MFAYEPARFVEPLGYQPVEFLDIPPMSDEDTREARTTQPGSVPLAADENDIPAEPFTTSSEADIADRPTTGAPYAPLIAVR